MRILTIRRSALAVLLVACTPWHIAAQPAPQVSFRIAERDPSGRATLSANQPLYLRITYTSSAPVRFRAKAYSGGELIERGARYNPAPPYPAGEGEALAWVSLDGPVQVDEIRVTALDERWQEIETQSFSVDASWDGVPARRRKDPAPWAERLSGEQQQITSTALDTGGNDIVGGLLVSLMGLSIPAYLLLQAYMLLRFRNGWRKAAMVPLAGMIPLGLFTLLGLLAGANLWPLAALFLAPLALAYLIVLGVIRFVIPRAAQSLG